MLEIIEDYHKAKHSLRTAEVKNYNTFLQAGTEKQSDMQCVSRESKAKRNKKLLMEEIEKNRESDKGVRKLIMRVNHSTDIVKGYCEYIVNEEEKTKGNMQTFLLENADGSAQGVNYSLIRQKVVGAFYIDKLANYNQSLVTTVGVSRVFTKLQ